MFNKKQWIALVAGVVLVGAVGGVVVPKAYGVSGTATGFFMAVVIGFLAGPFMAMALFYFED